MLLFTTTTPSTTTSPHHLNYNPSPYLFPASVHLHLHLNVSHPTAAMLKRLATTAPRTASRLIVATAPRATRTLPSALSVTASAPAHVRAYHEKVLDHYERPRNVGSMSKADADVGTGLVGAPACGDVMKLQIRVDPNDNTISEVKFKTFGCGSAIASSSYLTELVRGMSLEEAGKIRNTEIARELCLPPVKRE